MAGLHSPWLAALLALLSLLVLARLARLWPALRPLLVPLLLAGAAIVPLLALGHGALPEGPLALVYLLPALVLSVRAAVLLLLAVFRRRQGQPAPALLESLVSVLLYGVAGVIVAHAFFGVELAPLLGTSAVVGAVVGLALQDTLGNLFAGIALHTEAPVRAGDWVRVAERDAQVEEVSWRAMRLRTWDGDTLTLPNSEVARHALLNYSQPQRAHSRALIVPVSFVTPPNKVISVLKHLLEQVEGVVADPAPALRVAGYGDFGIQYEVRYFFEGYENYRRIEGEILRLVFYHFKRHGIEIPYPVRNVFLRQVEAADDGGEALSGRLERALRGIDLFRPLSDEELKGAAARFRQLHYAAGERIIEEGAPGDSFFVIDRGEVEVSKTLAGKAHTLARLMEGQFFGEMALLTGERRSASVVAVTDVDLFMIDKSGFEGVLIANPAIAVDISTILSERRELLRTAAGDATAPFGAAGAGSAELGPRLLERIRNYFGL